MYKNKPGNFKLRTPSLVHGCMYEDKIEMLLIVPNTLLSLASVLVCDGGSQFIGEMMSRYVSQTSTEEMRRHGSSMRKSCLLMGQSSRTSAVAWRKLEPRTYDRTAMRLASRILSASISRHSHSPSPALCSSAGAGAGDHDHEPDPGGWEAPSTPRGHAF